MLVHVLCALSENWPPWNVVIVFRCRWNYQVDAPPPENPSCVCSWPADAGPYEWGIPRLYSKVIYAPSENLRRAEMGRGAARCPSSSHGPTPRRPARLAGA